MRLLVKAPNDGVCPVDQTDADLRPYLHKKVKNTMKRQGKFIMRQQIVVETKNLPKVIFNRAMNGAVCYALEEGLLRRYVMV